MEAATLPVPNSPVIVVAQSSLEKLVSIHKGIKPSSLADKAHMASLLDDPPVDTKNYPFIIKGKKEITIMRLKTIRDISTDFEYAWLDEDSLATAHFGNWVIVTRGCDAASGPAGSNLKILDSCFNTHDIIQRGGSIFCYTLKTYAASAKQQYRDIACSRLSSVMPKDDNPKDGTRVSTTFSQKLVTK